MTTSAPVYTSSEQITQALRVDGYALLRPQDLCMLAGCHAQDLATLALTWDDLALDTYLKDGGRYRRRRHSCFVQDGAALDGAALDGAALTQTAHRAHWQPLEYNALHGGMHRLFEALDPATVLLAAWSPLVLALGRICSSVCGQQTWHVEAHQFRIDTTDGIGRPTPEGAHRDGVDFVAVCLVARSQVKGGETRVFDADGPNGKRFTLTEPWSVLLLDDARVVHETTPIQPAGAHGHRDTLVLTYRASRFQGEDA